MSEIILPDIIDVELGVIKDKKPNKKKKNKPKLDK